MHWLLADWHWLALVLIAAVLVLAAAIITALRPEPAAEAAAFDAELDALEDSDGPLLALGMPGWPRVHRVCLLASEWWTDDSLPWR